jgi:hypothetical protein
MRLKVVLLHGKYFTQNYAPYAIYHFSVLKLNLELITLRKEGVSERLTLIAYAVVRNYAFRSFAGCFKKIKIGV